MDTQTKNNYRTLRICTTHECNLDCFYCCAEGHKGKYSVINKSNLCSLISVCHSYLGISRVKYTGGEPLLFGDLLDVAESVRKNYNNLIHQSVVTNGVNTDRVLGFLKKIPYVEITLSVPSLNQKSFAKMQKLNSYQLNTSLNNIKLSLTELCNSGLPFKINYVLLHGVNDDHASISEIIDICNTYQNVNLRFLELISNDVNKVNLKYKVDKEKFFDSLQDKFAFTVIENSISHSQLILSNKMCSITYINAFCHKNCNGCPSDKSSIWVTSEGFVRSCNYKQQNLNDRIQDWDSASIREIIKRFDVHRD
jgi:cyclic pyranopterin phosphate synthase